MRILGIAGSLRRGSYNRKLLRAAAAVLPPAAEMEIWDGLAAVPPYNEDDDREPVPASALALRAAIEAADAVVISTPEYNGTLPGQLKNVIDWASRPYPRNALRAKPVAVIGTSTGIYGAVWAQADARKALAVAGANVLDQELAAPHAARLFNTQGELLDPELSRRLERMLRQLHDLTRATHEPLAA